jgi:hypothetical protein
MRRERSTALLQKIADENCELPVESGWNDRRIKDINVVAQTRAPPRRRHPCRPVHTGETGELDRAIRRSVAGRAGAACTNEADARARSEHLSAQISRRQALSGPFAITPISPLAVPPPARRRLHCHRAVRIRVARRSNKTARLISRSTAGSSFGKIEIGRCQPALA